MLIAALMLCSMRRIVSPPSQSLRDQSQGLVDLVDIHAGQRLVQHQQLRLAHERERDAEHALVPVGQGARL